MSLKFTRNVLLDILGLLLTIAAASYLGGMAGTWLGCFAILWHVGGIDHGGGIRVYRGMESNEVGFMK